MPMPDDGVLASVDPIENTTTLLRVLMRFDAQEYMGILRWDPPPPQADVEKLLRANLGTEIRLIGDLEI
jgi:hypothetical protein